MSFFGKTADWLLSAGDQQSYQLRQRERRYQSLMAFARTLRLEEGAGTPLDRSAAEEAARRCVKACERVSSYRAIREFHDSDGFGAHWWVAIAGPDRLHAYQLVVPHGDVDVWISIDDKKWHILTTEFGMAGQDRDEDERGMDESLQLSACVSILDGVKIASGAEVEIDRVTYHVLDGVLSEPSDAVPYAGTAVPIGTEASELPSVRFWIEAPTHLLRSMEITATAAREEGEQWVKLSHLFGDYDAPIEIPTPEPGRPFPVV